MGEESADRLWMEGDGAFFIDLDGTLVEIVGHPEHAELTPAARGTLERLWARAGGAVALISGRSIASVDRIVAPLRLPVAGIHGAERRDAAGGLHRAPPVGEEQIACARWELGRIASTEPGVLLEDKGDALAVHYRGAPALEEELRGVVERLAAASGGTLEVQPGKCVVELRPAGHDKGGAVRAFMAEAPFAGRRPVFLGDDLTDEAGFLAVQAMGGAGIKVGAGPTEAAWRLPDPEAVVAWFNGQRSAYREGAEGGVTGKG